MGASVGPVMIGVSVSGGIRHRTASETLHTADDVLVGSKVRYLSNFVCRTSQRHPTSASVRNRRVPPVAPRPREGPLTEPTAGPQPRPQERVLMRASPAPCPGAQPGQFHADLALAKAAGSWSLTILREKLIKVGAKVVNHGRYVTFQMAELAVSRQMFKRS